jgi:hypothetical protein
MEKKATPIIVQEIHLLRVEVVQQKLDISAFKKQKRHHLNVAHKLAHNLKEERIKLELLFSFENKQKEPLIFFQIDFHYQIKNLSNYYDLKSENHPVFIGSFLATLLGISFSTSRGIIFEKLKNSGISNTLLPIISPMDMLQKITTQS